MVNKRSFLHQTQKNNADTIITWCTVWNCGNPSGPSSIECHKRTHVYWCFSGEPYYCWSNVNLCVGR